MVPALVLNKFLFPPPPSLFMTAMTVVSGASLAYGGYMEIKGKHMQYSKLFNQPKPLSADHMRANVVADDHKEVRLPARTGMLVLYTPAFLAGLASLLIFPHQDFRFFLLSFALIVHFFKRNFEVLFVHKYSGTMTLEAIINISLSYFLSTATMVYNQSLVPDELPEPMFDLKLVGVGLFVIGIIGNFYHHILLSRMRGEREKEYKIPRGGLFDLVICPHYLFEILGFIGISCISQTIYPFAFTLGTSLYLSGRSYASRKWYISKFGDKFPNDVKALIPYIF